MAAPSLVLRPEICGRLGRPPPVAGALRRPLLVGVRRRLTVLADSCPSRRGCASACPCGARPNPVRAFARGQPLGFPTYPLCSPASLSRVALLVACSSPPLCALRAGASSAAIPPSRRALCLRCALLESAAPLPRCICAGWRGLRRWPDGAGFAALRLLNRAFANKARCSGLAYPPCKIFWAFVRCAQDCLAKKF